MTILGVDPSMSNTALVSVDYDIETGKITAKEYELIITAKSENKKIRASSDLVERCRSLFYGSTDFVIKHDPKIIFAETPSGSQSASGMKSYGVSCFLIGVLSPPPFEVTPNEVKMKSVGKKTASKEDMINWATKNHHELDWPMHGGKVNKGKSEHIADALATIYAGIETAEFKRLLQML